MTVEEAKETKAVSSSINKVSIAFGSRYLVQEFTVMFKNEIGEALTCILQPSEPKAKPIEDFILRLTPALLRC